MAKLEELEDSYAKKADRYYPLFGGFINGLISACSSLSIVLIAVCAIPFINEAKPGLLGSYGSFYLPDNLFKAIDNKVLIIPALAMTIPLFTGFIRHKKSRRSNFFSVLFGIIVAVIFTVIL